jgi:hypothetical protein
MRYNLLNCLPPLHWLPVDVAAPCRQPQPLLARGTAAVTAAAQKRNRNTRMAYARAVKQFFDWCDEHRLELHEIEGVTVAAYIEQLGNQASKPTVKQHLAA